MVGLAGLTPLRGAPRRCLTQTQWGDWSGTVFTPSSTRPAVREESWYDPLVEFLEIAVEVQVAGQASETRRSWLVHGPDANGAYGGLQGLGGLEAVYTHTSSGVSSGSWTGIVDDYYGHVIAHVEGEVVSEATLHAEACVAGR